MGANREDIAANDHSKEQLSLIGFSIDPGEADEDFEFCFRFENWPDGGLAVHLEDDLVIAPHIDA